MKLIHLFLLVCILMCATPVSAGGVSKTTVVSLNFNSTTGVTTDNAPGASTWTNSGTVASLSKKKFGTSSAYFSSAKMSAPYDTKFNINGGNASISYWMYINTAPASNYLGILDAYDGGTTTGYTMDFSSSTNRGKIRFMSYNGGTAYTVHSSTAPSTGAWHYVDMDFVNGNAYMYIDGVRNATLAYTNITASPSHAFWLNNDGSSTLASNIYLDDFEMTTGGVGYCTGSTCPVPTTELNTNSNELVTSNLSAYSGNLKLLLHGNGANAGTVFTDEKGHAFTAGGSATTSTTEPALGSASMSIPGSSSYITTPDSADFTLGTSPFTMSFWVKRGAVGSVAYIMGQVASSGADATSSIYTRFNADNTLTTYIYDGTTVGFTSTGTITDTTSWHQVVMERNATHLQWYIDGIPSGARAYSGTIADSSYAMAIGRAGEYTSSTFNGNIDEFALWRGVAIPISELYPQTTEVANPPLVLPALSDYAKNQTVYYNLPASAGTQTDYQVRFVLSNSTGVSGYYAPDNIIYTNGTTKATWIDVNATDGNGTPLPFWIEENTQTAYNATAWVKLPSISTANTSTSRWYYGNSSQTQNTQSGINTFPMFDDFNGAGLNTTLWNNWRTNGGTYSVSNGVLALGPGTGSNFNTMGSRANFTPQGYAFRIRAYSSSDGVNSGAIGIDDRSSTGTTAGTGVDAAMFAMETSKTYWLYRESSSTAAARSSTLTSYTVLEIASPSAENISFYENNVKKATLTTNVPTDPVGIQFQSCSPTIYTDWAFTRKYVYSEPTISLTQYQAPVTCTPQYIIGTTDYCYGQQFTTTASPGTGSLSGYQLRVNLSSSTGVSTPTIIYTNGSTQSDWRDIVFTDGSNTRLPFWIENNTYSSSAATAWVKVPTISTSGSTVRAYFGNSSKASSEMNGYATFELFDDFQGYSLNTTQWAYTGSPAISDGTITLTGTDYERVQSHRFFGYNYSVHSRMSMSYTTYAFFGFMNGTLEPNPIVGFYGDYPTSDQYSAIQRTISDAGTNTALGTSYTGYHVWNVARNNTRGTYFIDKSQVATLSGTYTSAALPAILYSQLAASTVTGDWIFVRQYQYPEPTYSAASGIPAVPAPVADFSANLTSGTAPLAVQFTDLSTNTPTSWSWTFFGTNTSTQQNPSYTFTEPGNYSISLTATNAGGSNLSTKTNYINVNTSNLSAYTDNLVLLLHMNQTAGSPTTFVDSAKGATVTRYGGVTTSTAQVVFGNASGYFDGSGDYLRLEGSSDWDFGTGDWTVSFYARPTSFGTGTSPYIFYTYTDANNRFGIYQTSPGGKIAVYGVSAGTIIVDLETSSAGLSTSGWKQVDVVKQGTGSSPIKIYINGTEATLTTRTDLAASSIPYSADAKAYLGTSWQLSGLYSGYLDELAVYKGVAVPISELYPRQGEIEILSTSSAPVADFSANVTSGTAPLAVQFTDLSTNTPTSWSWTFFGTNTSTQQNPSYTFTEPGNYSISLTATNAGGSNLSTKTNYINVNSASVPPVADFTSDKTSGAVPLTVGFTDSSTGSPTSWNWSFGDGALANTQNPSHQYTSAGNYTVRLDVSNADGSSNKTVTDYISVGNLPLVSFSASPLSGAVPLSVTFTDASVGATSWAWDFNNDGSTDSTQQSPTYSYSSPGTYSVKLSATNSFGTNSTTRASYITAGGVPVAGFVADKTVGPTPLTVLFTDTSTGSPTSWSWDFGDGNTATSQSPSHTYSYAGTYTVSLMATNSYGSDAETKTSYISTGTGPVAQFHASPTSGATPLTVEFFDDSTSATSWAWDFNNDGSTDSTEKNPVHTYSTPGTYSVKLVATGTYGTATITKTNLITTGLAPTAAFSASTTEGGAPLAVTFTDSSTNTPTSWSWSFGDGSTSTQQSPSHTYSAAGTYTVTLIATNTFGTDSEVKTGYITAHGPPVAHISAVNTVGYSPLAVTLTDASTGNPTSWAWDLGDGTASTDQHPGTHTYTGSTTITLTVSNAWGTSTATQAVSITKKPGGGVEPPLNPNLHTDTAVASSYKSLVMSGHTSSSSPTEVWFVYGAQSNTYSSRTDTQSPGSPTNFTATAEQGFYPGSAIYVRAASAEGYGNEVSVVIPGMTPIAQTTYGVHSDTIIASELDPFAVMQEAPKAYGEQMGAPSNETGTLIFWGFVISCIFIVLYLRSENVMTPALLGLVLGWVLANYIPGDFKLMGQALLVIALGALLFTIIKGRIR